MTFDAVIQLSLAIVGVMRDVAPIVIVMFLFQLVILRKPIPQLRRVLIGLVYVIVGLAFFLFGLEHARKPSTLNALAYLEIAVEERACATGQQHGDLVPAEGVLGDQPFGQGT